LSEHERPADLVNDGGDGPRRRLPVRGSRAPIVAVGGAEAGASGGTVAVDEAAAGLTNDSPDSDAVDPGLRSANGTVQLVVRFEEDAGSTLGDAEPSGAVSTTDSGRAPRTRRPTSRRSLKTTRR